MNLRLKEARLAQNLTQKTIASILNITQQTYSDYETKRTNPDLITLTKIADLLKVSTDYLLGRTDELDNIVIKYDNPADELTTDERELLANYRSLSDMHKGRVAEYTLLFVERNNNIKQRKK